MCKPRTDILIGTGEVVAALDTTALGREAIHVEETD